MGPVNVPKRFLLHKERRQHDHVCNMMCNHQISDILSSAFSAIVTATGRLFPLSQIIFYSYSKSTFS